MNLWTTIGPASVPHELLQVPVRRVHDLLWQLIFNTTIRSHPEPTAIFQFLLLSSDPEGNLSLQKMLKVCCRYLIVLDWFPRRVEITQRRKFILKLAKALLSFGAPSHRIESQLSAASNILDAQAGQYYLPRYQYVYKYITPSEFVHLPNIIIVSIRNDETRATRTYFVRSRGRIALTSLQKVHEIYRDVLHDVIGAEAGTEALRKLLRSPPIYSLKLRCFLAFVCASIICGLSFGGSILDVWVSGACACVLQYLGLNAANKSTMYANVYEWVSEIGAHTFIPSCYHRISVSIVVAFVARGLSNLPGDIFCYSAISSAGVVVILPGFTVCE